MTLKFPKELILGGEEWKTQPFRFNVHAINTGSYTPSYRDVTVTGVSPLNLPNAEANGLRYIKLFGKCEQIPNLFDKDKATLNFYINSSGAEQYNTSWACSDYIQVKEGCVYNLSGVTSYGNAPKTGFYAADKSFVSSRSQSSADFTIPDGVKYMRVSIYRSSIDTAVVKQVLSMDNPIPILCNNGEVGSTVYTVVGSPTISNDLVVSGFSTANYLDFTPNVILNNDFEIIVDFTTSSDLTSDQAIFRMFRGTSFAGGLILYASTKEMRISFSDGTAGPTLSGTFRAIENTHYKMRFVVKDGTFYYYYKSDTDPDWVLSGTSTTTINITDPITSMTLGRNNALAWGGSIDLKGFKLTVDGVPVRLTETVRIFGKNLFDQSQLLNATDWSLNSDGYYNGLFSSFNTEFTNGFEIDVPFKENTPYTFSCRSYVSDEGARARFVFVYTDESSKSLTIDSTSPAEYTLTTPSTKTLAKIRGTYASGASTTLYLKDIQLEEGVSVTDFQPYHASPTAVARDLLSCGDDYVDEQNITTGEITRKVGYLILNGTEKWGIQDGYTDIFYYRTGKNAASPNTCICTHFLGKASSAGIGSLTDGNIKYGYNTQLDRVYIKYSAYDNDLAGFKSWLAAQNTAGTPVIVVFPLEAPATESVTAQDSLQTIAGDNTITITQAAVQYLQVEVTYSAGVEVTIEAVQNANVDQQVEVTIGG